jgi:hypothetical protein
VHEDPPELPKRGSGLWKGADGRNEPGVDDHDANEVNTHADSQNRQASIC